MTGEQAFENRIKRFLKEQPDSTASITIKKLESYYPNFRSYYSLFDEFSFRLGIGIIAKEVVGSKTNKTIGYVPCLKYYADNLLKEEPRVEPLVSGTTPLKLNHCYDYLAKELLYRIMRIQNLEAFMLQ